jgi:hypothetical protein
MVKSGKLEIVLNQFAPTRTGFYLLSAALQVQPKLLAVTPSFFRTTWK